MRTCRGCGAELPPYRAPSPPRKWCSDRCRKAQYGGTCVDCGARTDGSNGRESAPERCRACTEHRNDERNARIVEAWERGEKAPEIAAREAVTPMAVMGVIEHRRRRKGESIALHRRQNRTLWPFIERRWREGATGAEIAAQCGTTQENVWVMLQTMREAGIDLPTHSRGGHPGHPEHMTRRAVQLYAAGQSSHSVAKTLGVSDSSVRNWARAAGVAVRPVGRYRKVAA